MRGSGGTPGPAGRDGGAATPSSAHPGGLEHPVPSCSCQTPSCWGTGTALPSQRSSRVAVTACWHPCAPGELQGCYLHVHKPLAAPCCLPAKGITHRTGSI